MGRICIAGRSSGSEDKSGCWCGPHLSAGLTEPQNQLIFPYMVTEKNEPVTEVLQVVKFNETTLGTFFLMVRAMVLCTEIFIAVSALADAVFRWTDQVKFFCGFVMKVGRDSVRPPIDFCAPPLWKWKH